MGNRKYRKPIDRYHPPTPMENNNTPSRTARRQAGKGSAAKYEQNAGASRGGRLLSILFFVFIFLPVFAVFLYVAVIYNPEEEKQISASSNNEVSFQENAEPITPLVIPDEQPAEEEPEAAESAGAVNEPEEAGEEPTATDSEEESSVDTEEAPEEAAVPEKPAEPEPETEQPDEPQQIHTVQKGETLYRIAISYYGTSAAVDRIMQANGMSTPDLSIGETLVLPN